MNGKAEPIVKWGLEREDVRVRDRVRVAQLVREKREEIGISQRQLGKTLEFSDGYVCRVESGDIIPSADSVFKIIKSLKLTPAERIVLLKAWCLDSLERTAGTIRWKIEEVTKVRKCSYPLCDEFLLDEPSESLRCWRCRQFFCLAHIGCGYCTSCAVEMNCAKRTLFGIMPLVQSKQLKIIVGSRSTLTLLPDDRERGSVEIRAALKHDSMSDTTSLHDIFRRCQGYASFINFEEVPSPLTVSGEDKPFNLSIDTLTQLKQTVFLSAGGPYINGFADALLLHYHQKLGNIPLQFAQCYDIPCFRAYHSRVHPEHGGKMGIAWKGKLIPTTPDEEIEELSPNHPYDDACVIIAWRNEKQGWIFASIGYHSTGTVFGTDFLFTEEFEKILSTTPRFPLFIILKVLCKKEGGKGTKKGRPVGFEVISCDYKF